MIKSLNEVMGLFAGTRQAAEKESMVATTYNACQNHGKSKVNPKDFTYDNKKAWDYLVHEGYVETWDAGDQMYCKLTDKCLEKMRKHGLKV